MTKTNKNIPEKIRSFFLAILFLSLPFSVAGDDFAITGLYLVTFYLLFTKKDKWENKPLLYAMGLFLFGAILSSLFSGDILNSFAYFRSFWRFGLPFLIFLSFKKRDYLPYLRMVIVVSSLIGIYSVFQSFTGIDIFRSETMQKGYVSNQGVWNAVGLFSHHLTYGGVSLLLFGLFAPNCFNRQFSKVDRILFTVGSLLNLAAVVVCMGRSIWLGTLVTIIFIVSFLLGWRKSVLVLGVGLVIVVGLFSMSGEKYQSMLNSSVRGRRITSILSTQQNQDRLMMWKSAIDMIKDQPIIGLGPNSGERMLPYYQQVAKKHNHKFQHQPGVGVHNIYLQNWLNFGLLGILGYFSIWLVLMVEGVKNIWRKSISYSKENSLILGIMAGMAGSMTAGVFENNFRDGEVQAVIFVIMGLVMVFIDRKVKK